MGWKRLSGVQKQILVDTFPILRMTSFPIRNILPPPDNVYEWMTMCGPLIGSFCCDIDVVMGTFCRRDDNHWSPFTESTFHVPCLDYCTKHNAITKPWAASPPTHITCCTISVSFIQNTDQNCFQ